MAWAGIPRERKALANASSRSEDVSCMRARRSYSQRDSVVSPSREEGRASDGGIHRRDDREGIRSGHRCPIRFPKSVEGESDVIGAGIAAGYERPPGASRR